MSSRFTDKGACACGFLRFLTSGFGRRSREVHRGGRGSSRHCSLQMRGHERASTARFLAVCSVVPIGAVVTPRYKDSQMIDEEALRSIEKLHQMKQGGIISE